VVIELIIYHIILSLSWHCTDLIRIPYSNHNDFKSTLNSRFPTKTVLIQCWHHSNTILAPYLQIPQT
jgi:hypothetical protein